MMSFNVEEYIDSELEEVRKKVASISNVQLISCVPVMVRVKYTKTKAKCMDICLQFPKDYPAHLLFLELKSKTLPEKFLDAVPRLLDKDKEKFIGSRQVLSVVRFCMEFLDQNPLCICSQEVANLKKLISDETGNWIKVKQKQMTIDLRIQIQGYYFQALTQVPEHYPEEKIVLTVKQTNFPEEFYKFFIGQGNEYARQCVEPPLAKKNIGKCHAVADFVAKPSVYKTLSFMVKNAQRYPIEECGICQSVCFPSNPDEVLEQEDHISYIDRIYCGHIFHHGCLNKYMSTPPFTGGKKCPKCQAVIYHEKWKSSEKTREERWAHGQAKDRELAEVTDFLS